MTAKNSPTAMFHRFPKIHAYQVGRENLFGAIEKIDLQLAWKIALKINNLIPRMRVCSFHFKDTDYLFSSKFNSYNLFYNLSCNYNYRIL